jgi:hypothetical protein
VNGIAHTLAVTVPVTRVPAALNPEPNVIVYDVVPDVNTRRVTFVPASGTVVVYVVVAVGVTLTTVSPANPIAVDPLAKATYPPAITVSDLMFPFVEMAPVAGATVKFDDVVTFVAAGDPLLFADNRG